MKNIKEILTENRESVISSIKWVCKVYSPELIKAKMIDFLAYAESNGNIEYLNSSTKIKSDLKVMVQRMAISQDRKREEEINIILYGSTKKPSFKERQGNYNYNQTL